MKSTRTRRCAPASTIC